MISSRLPRLILVWGGAGRSAEESVAKAAGKRTRWRQKRGNEPGWSSWNLVRSYTSPSTMMYRSCGVLWAATSAVVKVLDMVAMRLVLSALPSKLNVGLDDILKEIPCSKYTKGVGEGGRVVAGGKRQTKRVKKIGGEIDESSLVPFMNPHRQSATLQFPRFGVTITCSAATALTPILLCRAFPPAPVQCFPSLWPQKPPSPDTLLPAARCNQRLFIG